MSIRDWFTKAKPKEQPSEMALYRLPGGVTIDTHSGQYQLGFDDDPRFATRIKLVKSSPVQAAVRLISTSVSDLICNTLYIVDNDGIKVEPTTAQQEILNQFRYHPNQFADGYGFVIDCVTDLLLEGNCLIGIDRIGQRVTNLWRMIPRDAKTGTNSMGDDYYTGPVAAVHGEGMQFNRSRMIHARAPNFEGYNPSDDRRGFVKGPIHTLMQTLLITGYMDEYVANYFLSDASNFRLMFRGTDQVGEEEIIESRNYLHELAKKSKTRLPFLQHGMEPVPLNTTAIDSQMAALRAYQVRECSRIWGVPAVMLGEEKSGTNISALKQDFWLNCVKPHTQSLTAAMTMKLLNQPNGPRGLQYRFEVDPTELLKGDPETMAKLYQALGDAQRPGVITPSEWRKAGGWPAAMPDPNDTDERVYKDLKERQAGISMQSGGVELNSGSEEKSDDSSK